MKERYRLLDYLVNYGDFNNLRNALIGIEEQSDLIEKDVIQKLFLGLLGLESNRQRAFYELPTHELCRTISTICEELEIFKVEELGAGIGLLSGLLNKMTNLQITATDGKTWAETLTSNFYPVTEKLFLEYAMDDLEYDDKLIIMSWMNKKNINDLQIMMEKKKFKQILIIGEPYNQDYLKMDYIMENLNYTKMVLGCKQLCINDYFKHNKVYPVDSTKSCCTLYLRDNHDIELSLDILKEKISNDTMNVISNLTPNMVIQDMIIFGILPSWLLEYLEVDDIPEQIKKIILDIENCVKRKITIPDFIENIDEFEFWFDKYFNSTNQFPKIKERSKFLEYSEITNILNSDNGLELLKNKHIISEWIHNIDEAEKYLYLEFSYPDKKWKESREKFISYYNSTVRNINTNNPFATISSLLNGSIFNI